MRASWIVGFVAASLGLSACGATATIHSAVASVGSSPNVQIQLTGTASGPGTTEAQQVLAVMSIDVDFSNPSGAALSQAGTAVNSEVTVNVGTATLADLRKVSGNDYLMINPSALTNIPGVTLPTSEVNDIQLLLGGRWFELPKGFIDSYLPKTSATAAETAKGQAAVAKIVDAISKLINTTTYTTLPNNGGFSQTGSLESVLTTLLPTIESLEGTSTFTPPNVKGNYTLTLTMSGSSATGGSITITAPNGTQGNVRVGLQAAITHNSDSVVAPVGATIVTKALLKELLSQVGTAGIPTLSVSSPPLQEG
ncbi:MAG TPA: hypothetical protein VGP11_06830, partial [Acidimicrobiales bacterium]|nr:hypothetical protein [Acidimicrobiales bacterium]